MTEDSSPLTTFHPYFSKLISFQTGNPIVLSQFAIDKTIVRTQKLNRVEIFLKNILKKQSSDTALINIGGIANITYIEETLLGYDIGPGNCLVDAWCQRKLNKPYDDKGHWARTGKLNGQLLKRLLNEPYFYLEPPKSTGKELFNLDWLKKNITDHEQGTINSQDVQRTLLELTAVTISKSVKDVPRLATIIVCGGGAKTSS